MVSGKRQGINREGLLALLEELSNEKKKNKVFAAAQSRLTEATGLHLSLPLLIFVTIPQMFDTHYKREQKYIKDRVRASGQCETFRCRSKKSIQLGHPGCCRYCCSVNLANASFLLLLQRKAANMGH